MGRKTKTQVMWFLIGAVAIVMNIAGLGDMISKALGKTVTYS